MKNLQEEAMVFDQYGKTPKRRKGPDLWFKLLRWLAVFGWHYLPGGHNFLPVLLSVEWEANYVRFYMEG
jgi:hypothetical protein